MKVPNTASTSNDDNDSNEPSLPSEAVNAIRRGLETIAKIQGDKSSSNDTGKGVVRWVAVTDLGYTAANPTNPKHCTSSTEGESGLETVCFTCGIHATSAGEGSTDTTSTTTKLLKCSQCRVATYCSKSCQLVDWKYGSSSFSVVLPHKRICAAYQRIGPGMMLSKEADQRTVREEVLTKIRFYASPYAVHNTKFEGIGRGFLFLQSDSTLAQLSLPTGAYIRLPRWQQQQPSAPRSVLLHYLTLGEYDQELCRDDFELACVREELKKALESYDDETQVVYLMRFRCGHLAVGIAPLVPDYKLSCKLAKEYYGDQHQCQPIQLNLDDD